MATIVTHIVSGRRSRSVWSSVPWGTLGAMTPEAYLGKGETYNHQSLSATATATRRHKNKVGQLRRCWPSSLGRVLGMQSKSFDLWLFSNELFHLSISGGHCALQLSPVPVRSGCISRWFKSLPDKPRGSASQKCCWHGIFMGFYIIKPSFQCFKESPQGG